MRTLLTTALLVAALLTGCTSPEESQDPGTSELNGEIIVTDPNNTSSNQNETADQTAHATKQSLKSQSPGRGSARE